MDWLDEVIPKIQRVKLGDEDLVLVFRRGDVDGYLPYEVLKHLANRFRVELIEDGENIRPRFASGEFNNRKDFGFCVRWMSVGISQGLKWERPRGVPRLALCETLVAASAPCGRDEEAVGDHFEFLVENIVQKRKLWGRYDTWKLRLVVLTNYFRMVPVRAARRARSLWFSKG